MSSTKASSQPEHGTFPEEDHLSGQTAEEKALALSLGRLGYDIKPGQSGRAGALRWVCRKGYLDQVHLLLRGGSNDEILRDTERHGRTAAHQAALNGGPGVLRALLEGGADFSVRDHKGLSPLHLSVRSGHCEAAELLLANGSDPSLVDNEGCTPAWIAANSNQCDMLEVLATAGDDLTGVDINGDSLLHAATLGGAEEAFEMLVKTRAKSLRWRNVTGETPLHLAVESSTPMVKCILAVAGGQQFQDTNFDIDSLTFDPPGLTPLHGAACFGNRKAVELLLDYGANIHITNMDEDSALHVAARAGRSRNVRALIHRGADVNARHRRRRQYAVLDAVSHGHTQTFNVLLEGGASLTNVTAIDGYTALHLAAHKGNLGLLLLLLQNTSPLDINARSYKGITPLISATQGGRVDAARLLLEYGASISTSDAELRTPLHWAVERNRPHIVKLLLAHGASPAAVSLEGESPLSIARRSLEGQDLREMELLLGAAERVPGGGLNKIAVRQLLFASKSGDLDLITALVQNKSLDVNSADEDGYSGLLTASENGQNGAAKLLIRSGADVDAKNAAGESCIWLASRYGHDLVVRTLLENGADINSADELGQTAISASVGGGHLRVVELLLEKGADLGVETRYGKTVYMFAVDSGCDAIVNALLINGIEHLPQASVDQRRILATMREDASQRGMSIVDGNCGATDLGLGSSLESAHPAKTAVSSADTDKDYAGDQLGVHDGTSACWSDDEDVEDDDQLVHHGEDVEDDDQLVHDDGSAFWSDDDDVEDSEPEFSIVAMADAGRNAAVKRLIELGHEMEKMDRRGSLALGMAASKGHMSTVCTLLDHGFDTNLQDGDGRTALWWAAFGGWSEVAQRLMDFGANRNNAEDHWESPLVVAAMRGHVKVLDLFLMTGTNTELNGNESLLALKAGIGSGHVEVVKQLIKSGVNVEPGPSSEFTPLTWAVSTGKAKIVPLLIEAGAVFRTLSENRSLLCVAASAGHEDVVKMLLKNSADVDHLSDGGNTPLMCAASAGHDTTVRALIEVGGANVHRRNEMDLTAQSIAKMEGHEGIVQLLRHASRFKKDAVAAHTGSLPEWEICVYTPLSGRSCIRVLDLHPGLEDDDISFDLYEVDMNSGPSYKALSYEWKGESPLLTVQCNGRGFLITANLKLALQNIRSQEKTQTLWVDAICINQEDLDERSSQVLIMDKIYRQARKVLMWLGDDCSEIEEAVASIPGVLSAWAQSVPCDVFEYMETRDYGLSDELYRAVLNAAGRGKLHISQVDRGAFDILGRSYFTRAWIYQEMFLAGPRGLVFCGDLRVSCEDLVRFIYIWAGGRSSKSLSWRERTTLENMRTASNYGVTHRRVEIKYALEVMSQLNCSNPRDKVFAVLGTVHPSFSVELSPNYHLSVKQVYINAARVLIRKLGLSFWKRINYPATNKILGLPSWVPDWTCISTRLLEMNDGAVLPSLFDHPDGRKLPRLVNSQYHTTDTILFADGYVVGEVAFSVTMRTGEDIYDTIVKPLVEYLATVGVGIFDRCPCTETFSYLSVFCAFLCGALLCEKNGSLSLGLANVFQAYLARKIMADPNTPEASRKVPDELKLSWQEHNSRFQLEVTQFSQENHKICSEMEDWLRRSMTDYTTYSNDRVIVNCDLYCTRSGYLGVAGEGTAESGLILVLLQGYESVAMIRKRPDSVEDEWYEFVGGADILELDWESCETLEDLPMDGTLKRLQIL